MKVDNSIMAVNAYRYNAYSHTASDPSAILRVSGYPYYGWMIRRGDVRDWLDNWIPDELVREGVFV